MTMFTAIQSATILTMQRRVVVLLARLRRVLNGWVAAAIARRERQAALFALRQLDDPDYVTRASTAVRSMKLSKTHAPPQAAAPQVAMNETIARHHHTNPRR